MLQVVGQETELLGLSSVCYLFAQAQRVHIATHKVQSGEFIQKLLGLLAHVIKRLLKALKQPFVWSYKLVQALFCGGRLD